MLTVPFNVAEVEPTVVATSVLTEGAPAIKLTIDPLTVPPGQYVASDVHEALIR